MVVSVFLPFVSLEEHLTRQRSVMDFLLIVLLQRVGVDVTDSTTCT